MAEGNIAPELPLEHDGDASNVTSAPAQMNNPSQNQSKSQNQQPVKQEEKLWAMASYIPLVAFIALLLNPNSGYVRLHGRQGLFITIAFFFSIVLYILPVIGFFIAGLIQLVLFVIAVFSIFQAFMGNWWKIPVLGHIADKIPMDLFTKIATESLTGQQSPENQSTITNTEVKDSDNIEKTT